jgi:hypothetical protein
LKVLLTDGKLILYDFKSIEKTEKRPPSAPNQIIAEKAGGALTHMGLVMSEGAFP